MSKPTTQSDSKSQPKPDAPQKLDAVDQESAESFPSSDSPSGWAGKDIPPDERKAPKKN